MKLIISNNEASAIIGMWRMGNTADQIYGAMDIPIPKVLIEGVINQYINKNNCSDYISENKEQIMNLLYEKIS